MCSSFKNSGESFNASFLARNERTVSLIGSSAMEKLSAARVAIFGLGGVGGHCAEALCRAGVGSFDLIDSDTVCESNINRQIIADYTTLGRYKTELFCERMAKINPDCKVFKKTLFFDEKTLGEFDFSSYTYVVDAIDSVKSKLLLAKICEDTGVKIISSMGTGNKINPNMFEITDIYKTEVCPLARVMRRELKALGVKRLKVLYSKEPPISPSVSFVNADTGRIPVGSISFVPSVAGLIIASEVVRDIIGDK